MNRTRPSIRTDLANARDSSAFYFWGAVVSGPLSLIVPILGIVAAYTGYQLTKVMTRRWVGVFIAVLGALNFLFWLYLIVFVPEILLEVARFVHGSVV
ncbi:hypothetical protein [Halovivax gelatinilyticus]|uniref:hypothetical protein n=1 Tax=Halovivax gelatinilyticus TaxID=2961597 RepID=UPI0020CA8EB2|nr:hypothetical protein [Halovivax gelatinilyticus]